jgi:hypothetical protein
MCIKTSTSISDHLDALGAICKIMFECNKELLAMLLPVVGLHNTLNGSYTDCLDIFEVLIFISTARDKVLHE